MRVVITRPQNKSAAFADGLRSLGAEVVFFPTIDIQPVRDYSKLDRALSCLACYDWLVLTSANSVEALWARLDVLGIQSFPKNLNIAAVGPKTGACLQEHGFAPDFVPQDYLSDAILPGLGNLSGRWVLLPQADIAHDALPKAIAAADGIAHVITAYHTIPAQPDPEGLDALRKGVHMLTFASGSTARNFISLLKGTGLDPLQLPGNPEVAVIGPKTASAAKKAGFRVDIIAAEHTLEGLLAAIQSHQAHGHPKPNPLLPDP